MARLLGELAALWPSARITLLAADGSEAEHYAEPLLQQGIEVVCPPVDWERWFEERRFHYGVVIVSRQQNVSRFQGHLNQSQPQALRVFDTEAFTFLRLERLAELLPPGNERSDVRAEAAKARETEIRAVQESDLVFCVSEDEARFIAEVAPTKPTFVLTSCVEPVGEPPPFDERSDLVFFGGFLGGSASPNEDSLSYLVHQVLPLFWEEHPDVGLNVIGADMGDSVRALDGPRVRIVGFVEEPLEWLSRARLHVNPMRFGSGIKLKFLDSLAAGLPFITTTIGAEGIPLGDLRASLVADDPAGLAQLMGEPLHRSRRMGACPDAPARVGYEPVRSRQLPADADRGDGPHRRRPADEDLGRMKLRRVTDRITGRTELNQESRWEWSELKQRKQQLSDEFHASARTERLVQPIEPTKDHLGLSVADWIRHQVEAESYWFQKIELFPGFYSPGWQAPPKTSSRTSGCPTT